MYIPCLYVFFVDIVLVLLHCTSQAIILTDNPDTQSEETNNKIKSRTRLEQNTTISPTSPTHSNDSIKPGKVTIIKQTHSSRLVINATSRFHDHVDNPEVLDHGKNVVLFIITVFTGCLGAIKLIGSM